MRYVALIISFLFLLLANNLFAKAQDNFSLDVNDVSIVDALHIIADFLHENIIINQAVSGNVSLHLHKVSAEQTFNMLLESHDLVKTSLGGSWLIMSQKEWQEHQQIKLTRQETSETKAPLITHSWQIHYAKAEDILHMLQDNTNFLLSKRGHARVDPRTNMLFVQDIPATIKLIQELINKVDVPVQQVLIDARLASIDSDFERDLGVNFSAITSSDDTPKQGYSLWVMKLADGSLLDVQLTALEQEGHGELISRPHLFTANQQAASIESGEEIPYQEISRSGATGVAFKKAVLSLKVTPQIMPNNKVLLELTVNQDKPNDRIVLGVPAITTREIHTNVLVNNGQTLVLGGIYETDKEQTLQSIPFLGKIPLLGLLFQQHNTRQNKRDLLIFVTPKIIPQDIG